jgi:hypothetical protein
LHEPEVDIPPPKDGFVRTLTRLRRRGPPRWRGPEGFLYEWDRLHGEFEVFNPRGRHVAVLDRDGKLAKHAVKGRTIDV